MTEIIQTLDDGSSCGILKKLQNHGKGEIPKFSEGTKVTFHYTTRKCNEEHTVLDSSKNDSKAFELIIGKKFKLEAWETCVKSMKRDEVASFTVHPTLLISYPLVSKSLRDIKAGKKSHGHHCCGSFSDGLGYEDLNLLMKEPQPLEFIIEIVKIEEPGQYEKDVWIMNEQEKLSEVPKLKEQGNELYRSKKHKEAADIYAKAIGMLEQLLLREKPGDEPYLALIDKKLPILLNYSQCKLLEGEYYQVIEHTTEVLRYKPDNVKALFRRAKAHAAAWNPNEARSDFKRVIELDSTLAGAVKKELRLIEEEEKKRENEDRSKLQGKLFT